MKWRNFTLAFAALCLCVLFGFTNRYPKAQGEVLSETYVGNSPCGNFIKAALGIPTSADCERVQWKLTFYKDDKMQPSVFKLTGIYGIQVQGGPGFVGGGNALAIEGRWRLTKGAKTNPEATVHQLETANGQHTILFVKMNDDILHLLYSDGSLMIGNGGWSYTLNRVKR